MSIPSRKASSRIRRFAEGGDGARDFGDRAAESIDRHDYGVAGIEMLSGGAGAGVAQSRCDCDTDSLPTDNLDLRQMVGDNKQHDLG